MPDQQSWIEGWSEAGRERLGRRGSAQSGSEGCHYCGVLGCEECGDPPRMLSESEIILTPSERMDRERNPQNYDPLWGRLTDQELKARYEAGEYLGG